VWKGRISRVSSAPLPQRGRLKRNPIWGFLLFIYIHPLTQNYQIKRGNTYGTGLILSGHSRLHPKEAGSQLSPIWGFLSIYAYTLCRRTTKFDVAHVGRGVYLGISCTPPIPRERSFSAPPPMLWVLLYLCLPAFVTKLHTVSCIECAIYSVYEYAHVCAL